MVYHPSHWPGFPMIFSISAWTVGMGSDIGPTRATVFPSGSTTNLVKFHLIPEPKRPPSCSFSHFHNGAALLPFTSTLPFGSVENVICTDRQTWSWQHCFFSSKVLLVIKRKRFSQKAKKREKCVSSWFCLKVQGCFVSKTSVGTFANMSKVAPCEAAKALISALLPENKSNLRRLASPLHCHSAFIKIFNLNLWLWLTRLLGAKLIARKGKNGQLTSFATVLKHL